MSRFAEGTSVSVEKSRAEIETLLRKHGILDVGIMSFGGGAVVIFRRGPISYKIAMPPLDPAKFKPGYRQQKSQAQLIEQEERRRWRALGLVLKAKLVAASDGVVTFEQEFLAFALTANGKTVGENVIPQLHEHSFDIQKALPGAVQ